MDKVRFKVIFSFILILQLVLAFTYNLVGATGALYFTWLALTNIVQGGVFVSTCTFFGKTFGAEIGSKAYSYLFTAYSISGICLAIVVYFWQSSLGYSGILYICGGLTVIAIAMLTQIDDGPF